MFLSKDYSECRKEIGSVFQRYVDEVRQVERRVADGHYSGVEDVKLIK